MRYYILSTQLFFPFRNEVFRHLPQFALEFNVLREIANLDLGASNVRSSVYGQLLKVLAYTYLACDRVEILSSGLCLDELLPNGSIYLR